MFEKLRTFIEPEREKPMSNYFVRDPTLYKKLGVSPTAKQEEIVKKFHEKIRKYHPDQQFYSTPQSKEYAQVKTQELNAAYEILKDAKTRVLYDIAGLDQMKKITLDPNEDYSNLDDLRNRVRNEKRRIEKFERERLSQLTTNTSIGFNLQNKKKLLASPLESVMQWQQPLTENDTLVFHANSSFSTVPGTSQTNVMNGMTYRHIATQKDHFAIQMLFRHSGQLVKRAMQESNGIILGGNYEFDIGNGFTVGANTMTFVYPTIAPISHVPFVTRDLGNDYKGTLALNLDTFGSSLEIRGDHGDYETRTKIKGGMDNEVSHEYETDFGDGKFHAKGAIGHNLRSGLNYSVELGVSTLIQGDFDYSIGTSYEFSTEGVNFNLNFKKNRNEFTIPIHIADELNLKSFGLGVLVPSILTLLFSKFVLKPIAKRKKLAELAQKREINHFNNIPYAERAQEWLNSVKSELMRNLMSEESVHGLIIQSARYGVLDEEYQGDHPGYIDVTQALQYQVNNHKIHLAGAIKSILPGFYDPCPGELKTLEVVYLFRDTQHRVEIEDEDELNIPLEEHILDE